MAIETHYLFTASMDVDPDKEDLFNEVYDTEHIPNLYKVPGLISVTRLVISRSPWRSAVNCARSNRVANLDIVRSTRLKARTSLPVQNGQRQWKKVVGPPRSALTPTTDNIDYRR